MGNSPALERPVEAVRIALIVAVVCALLVSISAVSLRPFYVANLEAERMERLGAILDALQNVSEGIDPQDIEVRVVDLASGSYSDAIDPLTFDAQKAASDPNRSYEIPPDQDSAGIRRRAKESLVYLVRKPGGQLAVMILPVWGVGYQSALYGYLALAADAGEILALKFYEHGETPGLGSRIQDPAWEAQWTGKQAFDDDGSVSIQVSTDGKGGRNHVDGISGATRTSLGVAGLVRFWLGDFGFGPYLERVRQGAG